MRPSRSPCTLIRGALFPFVSDHLSFTPCAFKQVQLRINQEHYITAIPVVKHIRVLIPGRSLVIPRYALPGLHQCAQ